MTTELDLDDVAAQSKRTQKELEQLRQQRDELREALIELEKWVRPPRESAAPGYHREYKAIYRKVRKALTNLSDQDSGSAGKEE